MASFSETALVKKLAELNASQQSIQTLSLWLIHHRKHSPTIVKVWYRELLKAADPRKITFIYLANDVIQNSKKKGPEYGKDFGSVLRKALDHLGKVAAVDAKCRNSLGRVIQIWDERGVFNSKEIAGFKQALNDTKETSPEPIEIPEVQEKVEKVSKRKQKEKREKEKEKSPEKHHREAQLSPTSQGAAPPEPEVIIKSLMDLENSASSDVAVREAIAHLPPEVTDTTRIQGTTEKSDVERLSHQVNAAVKLLSDYNQRLSQELEDRKKVTAMLRDFTHHQVNLLNQAKERLEEYQEKLEKVHQVRQEVRSHIQNLPDISQLPDVTGGLAPLPSAGDLFSLSG